MIWIDHLQHDTICKPQPSIGRSRGSPERSTARLHTVNRVKNLKLHPNVRLCPPSLHFAARNFDEPALSTQPKSVVAIFNECIHSIARKAVPDCEVLLFSLVPSDKSQRCCS